MMSKASELAVGMVLASLEQSHLDKADGPDQVVFVKVINVQEAKTHLSRLLERVAAGEVILLGKHGKPMAKLSAFNPAGEMRPLGGFEGRIRMAADFDDEDPHFRAFFGTDA